MPPCARCAAWPASRPLQMTATIDVGAHLLWTEAAHAPVQAWAGFRFPTMPEPHRQRLGAWIAEEQMLS
ncbi:type IV pilus assembly protein PilZ [Xanthomonas fragariae LMG 25863]|nr:type IV pilus assembly protein PilZ [Xanthomonas fragariae LMG 25863]